MGACFITKQGGLFKAALWVATLIEGHNMSRLTRTPEPENQVEDNTQSLAETGMADHHLSTEDSADNRPPAMSEENVEDASRSLRQRADAVRSEKGALTPMMAQFLDVKATYDDTILFYRMGDFYEMFFDDAVLASSVLGIALTKRGQFEGQDIPMCGVPVHAMDGYLSRLITAGLRVAVCEQATDPETFKKEGGKGPLPRHVVRVITAGTLQEDIWLQADTHNYLAAVVQVSQQPAVAWADMSTGDFQVQEIALDDLEAMLARLNPAEIICPTELELTLSVFGEDQLVRALPARQFDSQNGAQALCTYYGVSTLDGLGAFSRAMRAAAGGLLAYLKATQIESMPRLSRLRPLRSGDFMEIDPATRRSLELTQTLQGERKGSLLAAVDRTLTPAGKRVLASRIAAPLAQKAEIDARLSLADWFLASGFILDDMRQALSSLPDMERCLGRIASGRGGPRDLAQLALGLEGAEQIALLLSRSVDQMLPDHLVDLLEQLQAPLDAIALLRPALADELPAFARDGNFIRAGYQPRLDECRSLRDESRRHIAALQQRYADETGITALKIKHNNVLGYHIEVRSTHSDKLLQNPDYIHRQTTAQAMRFTTPELTELERDLKAAADRTLAIEMAVFAELCDEVMQRGDAIAATAHAVAVLDVAAATSQLARHDGYCRPIIRNDTHFDVESGRHPVVEQTLDTDSHFIANDCALPDTANLWLLTGPNMAGKSTFLRQNAHIVILAQAGLYVPATRAEIGVCDRVFSRVGASDDLARGRSTFMVEMVETATILNRASNRSLVILDEIGRGTATYDGLAIACATLEHLHEVVGCRTLFATHYHELGQLAERLGRMRPHTMKVSDWQGEVIFLHQVVAGSADRSYGVHVAKLAGLPEQVVERAEALLSALEHQAFEKATTAKNNGRTQSDSTSALSLPLFAPLDTPPPPPKAEAKSEVESQINDLDIDSLTPKQALDMLYQLKSKLGDKGGS